MDYDYFKKLYLGSFEPTKEDQQLWELAKEYHDETEEYDRKVCSGI